MRTFSYTSGLFAGLRKIALWTAAAASVCVIAGQAAAAPKGPIVRTPVDRPIVHQPARRPEHRPQRPAPRPPRYGYGPRRPGHGPAHRPHHQPRPHHRPRPPHRPRPHHHIRRYSGSFFELIFDLGNLIFVGGTSDFAEEQPREVVMRTVSADIVPSTRGDWTVSAIDGSFELKSALILPDDTAAGDIVDVRPMFWGAEKQSTLAWYDASTSEVTIRGKSDPNFGTNGAELLRLDVVLNDGTCLRQDLALPVRELI